MKKLSLLIDRHLNAALPSLNLKPKTLSKSLRYSTLSGGKRIRPTLCIASYRACGKKDNNILPIACALELVHTFSLIHDDLPCMDNDDLRRGKPTSHKVFGEDIAVLSGDALLNLAFEFVLNAKQITAPTKVIILKELSNCVGHKGIIGGQVLDLLLQKKKPTLNEIKDMYKRKTSSLIVTSVRLGAITAGTPNNKLKKLTIYGNNLGLAFQVIDDILDSTQDKKETSEINYCLIYGRKKARTYAHSLIANANKAIETFGVKAKTLKQISNKVIGQIL